MHLTDRSTKKLLIKAEKKASRMVRYVVGIVLSEDTKRVLLIHKSPNCEVPSLRDTWNGIGGKQKHDELPSQAMRRECREETGLDIKKWRLFGILSDKVNYRVNVFWATTPLEDARTMESEEVRAYTIEEARTLDLSPGLETLLDEALQYA